MWLRVTISEYSIIINNRFFTLISSILIISANFLNTTNMENLFIFFVIAFFIMLLFSPYFGDTTKHNF